MLKCAATPYIPLQNPPKFPNRHPPPVTGIFYPPVMGIFPCIPSSCTLSKNQSSKNDDQYKDKDKDKDISESQRFHFDTKSLSSQPSLPSVPSLTSHAQPISTTTNYHYITTLKNHTSPIFALALTSKNVISASSDSQIRIWPRDMSSLTSSSSSELAAYGFTAVKTMVVHGEKLFTGHQDNKIRVWKINEKQKVLACVATMPTFSNRIMKIVFAKNYVEIRRHRMCTWVHHVDVVSCLALSKDGTMIYSGSWDRTFKVWRTSDYKCLESVWNAHDDAINALVVSHDCVYTGSADRKIKVWRKPDGEKKHKLVDTLEKHKSAVNALALSTDGSILYSGACDRSIIVWEKPRGGNGDAQHMVVSGALRGHSKAILCINVVGDVVFSGSADKTIRIWRRGIDGKSYLCLGILEGHKGPIKCLAAALDSGTSSSHGGTSYLVYGGSLDCDIKLWSLWVPLL